MGPSAICGHLSLLALRYERKKMTDLCDAVEVGKASQKKEVGREMNGGQGENRLGEFRHQQPKSTVGVSMTPHLSVTSH
jgi:hypothetical protein